MAVAVSDVVPARLQVRLLLAREGVLESKTSEQAALITYDAKLLQTIDFKLFQSKIPSHFKPKIPSHFQPYQAITNLAP